MALAALDLAARKRLAQYGTCVLLQQAAQNLQHNLLDYLLVFT